MFNLFCNLEIKEREKAVVKLLDKLKSQDK